MDAIERLKFLSRQMFLEPAEENRQAPKPYLDHNVSCPDTVFIHPAVLPNGQRIKLLKTLLTSACERDCYYCPFRAGRDLRRATFQPEEYANLFMMLYHKGIAEGFFLSSGMIGGGVRTQDKLLATAEILRQKMGFQGYIHLKIMPGAERAQVERTMQLANRISVNLEAPNTTRLARLAPHKQFIEELIRPLRWIDEIRRTQSPHRGWKGRWPSSVTQFVAGGAGESDLELLSTTSWLHKNLHLTRTYFSAFQPIENTPLENQPPTPPLREHRLYQASFLLRDYAFDVEDLPFSHDGNLPIQTDPKLVWAQTHLSQAPVEINLANRHDLLRVPGIGPKGAEAILRYRKDQKLREVNALRRFGIYPERAAPFILLDGRRAEYQLTLLPTLM